jgi:hypothetical protein
MRTRIARITRIRTDFVSVKIRQIRVIRIPFHTNTLLMFSPQSTQKTQSKNFFLDIYLRHNGDFYLRSSGATRKLCYELPSGYPFLLG